jgi:hypothetical protein
MFSSLSLRLKPRLTGPLLRKVPVPIGARLMRVDPGGGAVSADGLRDLLTVDGAYLETVSGAWCIDVCRLKEEANWLGSTCSEELL